MKFSNPAVGVEEGWPPAIQILFESGLNGGLECKSFMGC